MSRPCSTDWQSILPGSHVHKTPANSGSVQVPERSPGISTNSDTSAQARGNGDGILSSTKPRGDSRPSSTALGCETVRCDSDVRLPVSAQSSLSGRVTFLELPVP